jgi:hypothetical protein
MPSVLGGGRGDVEEVLAAGERLARAGARVRVLVRRSTNKRWLGDASFGWERFPRLRRLPRIDGRALTLSSHFGVTAPEPREEPFGGPGPWTEERRAIDAAYGPERTLHVSLEEFARTLTSRRQADERHREGGRGARERRRRRAAIAREAEEAHALYRKFRALDRPNLLPLFPTFAPSRAFAREFPESVQCGPLWSALPRRPPSRRVRRGTVVWYASPSSAPRIAAAVGRGLRAAGARRLEIRAPIAFRVDGSPPPEVAFVRAEGRDRWARRWRSADLRIATGSRSLLEALAVPGPFLYFNGVLGHGAATRRHRPEKLDALLEVWRRQGVDRTLRRDLADFSRGRRVAEIIERALGDRRWRRAAPRRPRVGAFPVGFADAGELLVSVAHRFGQGSGTSAGLVRTLRAESRHSKA